LRNGNKAYSALTSGRTADRVAIRYRNWIAVNRDHAMAVAKSPEAIENLSVELRLLLLAYARMNSTGHATFAAPRGKPEQSELRELLGHVDMETGERVLCAESTIYRAKGKLAKAGLLVESSGGLVCVWVAVDHAHKGNGGAGICPFHRWRRAEVP
jgi:hypothetical protein